MRKLWLWLALTAIANLWGHSAIAADRYAVSLTRKDRNLYKVDGQSFWVQTRYCYTYAYGEEAALNSYEVVFMDSGNKCDVKRVLKETSLPSGSYEVRLTHEDDDLYSTLEGVYLKTSLCLHLGISDEAILRWNGYGGTVIFVESNQRCQVDEVLTKARL